MKLLAKKLNTKEERVPVNGLKKVFRYTQFEIEEGNSIDILWIADHNIQSMELLEDDLYEIEVDSEYLALLLDSQE